MKFAIPEISWHNRDPVLSVDFQPKSDSNDPLRLATGGTDSHVLIWYISTKDTGSVNLEVAADLTRHQKAVNVVRWSPNGQYLASGDDESIIFVWKQKTEEPAPPLEGEEQYKETWVIHKTLRGHMEDILDISWNSSSTQLVSGSVDNKMLVWDVGRGKYTTIVTDHKGFVQGVAWDPKGQLIASASTDRVFRTFDVATKKVLSRSSKAVLPFPKQHALHEVRVRLYHDDTLQTYYRRLDFSPDGLLIAVPAGKIEPEQGKLDVKPIDAVYIYTRYSLKVPACVLPCAGPALVVRWSPARYALRSGGPRAALPAPHRTLLAVGTKRSLLVYDTQQKTPIALITNMHYTRLTDLTWSPDGRILVASSTDGFCSVVSFSDGELGEVLPDDIVDPATEPMEVSDEQQNDKEVVEDVKESKPETKQTHHNTLKMDSFIKFKAPGEKSPKKGKSGKTQQRTPVKLDLLVETAMPSWSDNSSNDIIKPKETEPMEVDKNDEIMVIEDSEDIKLVYEETETKQETPSPKENKKESTKGNKTETSSQKDDKADTESQDSKTDTLSTKDSKTDPKSTKDSKTDPKSTKDSKTDPKSTKDSKTDPQSTKDSKTDPKSTKDSKTDPKSTKDSKTDPQSTKDSKTDTQPTKDKTENQPKKEIGTSKCITPTTKSTNRSPKKRISPKQCETPTTSENSFLKQAKVTDMKVAVGEKSAPSPKAPRRVSFVTLSSPKNSKKK